jgi:hypothetical protein
VSAYAAAVPFPVSAFDNATLVHRYASSERRIAFQVLLLLLVTHTRDAPGDTSSRSAGSSSSSGKGGTVGMAMTGSLPAVLLPLLLLFSFKKTAGRKAALLAQNWQLCWSQQRRQQQRG